MSAFYADVYFPRTVHVLTIAHLILTDINVGLTISHFIFLNPNIKD